MKKYLLTTLVLISFVVTGCVQNISPQGVTIDIPAYKINDTLQESFPIKQSFSVGDVALSNPKTMLKRGSDRVEAGTSLSFSNPLIPTQRGSLYISGKPFFDPKTKAIYLRSPMIERLELNGYKLSDYVSKPLQRSLQPIIDDIFANRPIYRLNPNSLQSSFVKNIYIEDGKLLLTFGL